VARQKRKNEMEYKAGQKVHVRLSWQDDDCWTTGRFIKATAKRVQVDSDIRGVAFFSPHNVRPA